MDKNAIKKFAVWARRELIARVSQRAAWYGITEKDPIDEKAQVIHGKVLTEDERMQRRALIRHIREHGYQQVMEEVAYTWFNRFIALRFMEVNAYLPSYTRVFSDDSDAYNPQILKDAIHLDLAGLDVKKVYAMEEANETEALFKYLVITQCNDLNRMLPGMFQKIADYSELLFPDFLLREGSVAHQMVTTIPEDDWKDAVQIIGWLYQYYNAEPKDEVFAQLKKNIKISKEKIPAATQLFTPDWIVRYMVENSLGRLWLEGRPNEELKASWKYYLEEAPQEAEVEAQLAAIRAEYAQIEPASILCVDPCMGSGHILVYMFDVLMQIYLSYGYTTNEAVESIVRNNLWGMDIDDRAAQLAYFAVMMKAQQYDHRWLAKQLRHPVQPRVFALQESGDWPSFERRMRQAFMHHPSLAGDASIRTAKTLFETFADAKEYGSIIQPDITLEDLDMLEKVLDEMAQKADLMDLVAQADAKALLEVLKPLILQARALVQKYHSVVTNPPYMAISSASSKLNGFINQFYVGGKTDLFSVFIERCMFMTKQCMYTAMITMQSWMFLTSFEPIRHKMLEKELVSMAHLGPRGFDEISGEVVQTVAFVINNYSVGGNYIGSYSRLIQGNSEKEKADQYCSKSSLFHTRNSNFRKIPQELFAYWVSESTIKCFDEKSLGDVFVTREGMATADNDRFLRYWYEVDRRRITIDCHSSSDGIERAIKWVPYNKGGTTRYWYGNNDYVVDWVDDGYQIKNNVDPKTGRIRSHNYNGEFGFREGLTWSAISSDNLSVRYCPEGYLFDSKGAKGFSNGKVSLYWILGLLNSKVSMQFLQFISPTLDFKVGDIITIPFISDERKNEAIEIISRRSIDICKEDWDSFETSWDFQHHPLVWFTRGLWDGTLTAANLQEFYGEMPQSSCPLETCYLLWQGICNQRFDQLKSKEEELNRIFIDIYGLQDELSPTVDDKDVTVRKADLGRDIRSFISYAIGCMFGRYSLDKDGLVLAGQKFDSRYAHNPEGYQYGDPTTLQGDYLIDDDGTQIKLSYTPDRDGILPITDDEYFDDDIVGMFIDWVRTVYGAETLEANLKFIAEALGGKGNPREVIRQYFLNDFYKDHLKIYQKRPIYWLFDSGKKNGFKCLIYMHRYQPDTIARIRTDYLHETQARYRNAIETLERQSHSAATSERVKMTKRLNALKAQAEEARVYEEKIHHLADQMIKIDLDDGVKVNYAKFADVLAPIK